jgi:hypothetical protein
MPHTSDLGEATMRKDLPQNQLRTNGRKQWWFGRSMTVSWEEYAREYEEAPYQEEHHIHMFRS